PQGLRGWGVGLRGLGKGSPAGLDRVQGFIFCHAKHGLAIAKIVSQSLFIGVIDITVVNITD
ncbi:hypothetical protein Q0O08_23435, partial [Bacillus thuringiensis]